MDHLLRNSRSGYLMHYFAQRIGCVLHLAWVGTNVDSVAHQGGFLRAHRTNPGVTGSVFLEAVPARRGSEELASRG